MVGTPAKNVTSSFCIRSTAACASNRGSSTSVEAIAKPAFICTVDPKEWKSGSVTRWVSVAGWALKSRLQVSALSIRLLCESSAPFAWPVVPEV